MPPGRAAGSLGKPAQRDFLAKRLRPRARFEANRRICGGSWAEMEQQNERATILQKKAAASDTQLAFATRQGGGVPAKICAAKFCGEKEE